MSDMTTGSSITDSGATVRNLRRVRSWVFFGAVASGIWIRQSSVVQTRTASLPFPNDLCDDTPTIAQAACADHGRPCAIETEGAVVDPRMGAAT